MITLIKKHHRKVILTAPILFLMIAGDATPKGNGVFLRPSTAFPEIGTPFTLDVNFKSNNPINATDGTLLFPKQYINVERIDIANSAIDLWGATPEWSNSNGVVTWSGGIIKPILKDNKQEGNIIRISMIASQSVPFTIAIKDATMLASNGNADNIIETAGSVRVYPRPKGTPSPDIDGDRKITARDVTQVILGIGKPYNARLDINNDKVISFKDANLIITYYDETNKTETKS